jgi:hypothetical protein
MDRARSGQGSSTNAKFLRLCWKKRLVGDITDVAWTDFPWVSGRVKLKRLTKELRQILKYVFKESRSEEGLRNWPFADDLFWNWSILKADETREEIGIPIIDFTDGSIEWR